MKIWENRISDTLLKTWEKWVVFDTYFGIRQATLSNVEVEGHITIKKNEDPLLHLVLSNCRLPNLELENAKLRSLIIENNSATGEFSIYNSSIGDISIRSNSKTKIFRIFTNSKVGHFEISDHSKSDDIIILESCTIKSFYIYNNSISKNIRISGNSSMGNIRIENNSTILDFWITDYSSIGDLTISSNSTIWDLYIYNSKGTILDIRDKCKVAKIIIQHSDLHRIWVLSDSFVGYLKCQFTLLNPVHLILGGSVFGYIDFDNSVFPEFTTMSIKSCTLNYLSLNNFCNYGTVFFSGLLPLEKWEDFARNENGPIFLRGLPRFETFTRPTCIRFTDSDLGKMQFINCDLRQFDRFEFSNTKMLDVFAAGSQMPGENAFCLPDDEKNSLNIAEQKRLAYGQFKKIYEARGDVAGSLPYLAYEMEAYRQQLKMEGSWKNKGELALLWMNKISTNYGNSWGQGLKMILISIVFCYSIFLGSIGHPIGNPFSWEDWKEAFRLYSYAPHFINPLRDADSIILVENEKELSSFARFWDFFSRIIVAYFAYQTIQAFRKLGKSSG